MDKKIRGKSEPTTETNLPDLRRNETNPRATKNEREKKKAPSVRFKTNQWFDSDEGSFYKHLTNIVKATKGNIKPKFKSRDSGPGRENVTTTTKDEIEEFWRPIWENSRDKVHQDDWIRGVETAFKQRMQQN